MSRSSFEYNGYYLATRSNVFFPTIGFLTRIGYNRLNMLDEKVKLLIKGLRKEAFDNTLGFIDIDLEEYIDITNEDVFVSIISDTLAYIKTFNGFIPREVITSINNKEFIASPNEYPRLLDTCFIEDFLELLVSLIKNPAKEIKKYEEDIVEYKKSHFHFIRSLGW